MKGARAALAAATLTPDADAPDEAAAGPGDTAATADDTAVPDEAAIDEPAEATAAPAEVAAELDDTAAELDELQAAAVRQAIETTAATATLVILLRPELPRRRTESMNKVSLHCDSGGWTGAGWTGAGWTGAGWTGAG